MKNTCIPIVIVIIGLIISIIFIGLDAKFLSFVASLLPNTDWKAFCSILIYIIGGIWTAPICLVPAIIGTAVADNIAD